MPGIQNSTAVSYTNSSSNFLSVSIKDDNNNNANGWLYWALSIIKNIHFDGHNKLITRIPHMRKPSLRKSAVFASLEQTSERFA